jgi:hypothetical protein
MLPRNFSSLTASLGTYEKNGTLSLYRNKLARAESGGTRKIIKVLMNLVSPDTCPLVTRSTDSALTARHVNGVNNFCPGGNDCVTGTGLQIRSMPRMVRGVEITLSS